MRLISKDQKLLGHPLLGEVQSLPKSQAFEARAIDSSRQLQQQVPSSFDQSIKDSALGFF